MEATKRKKDQAAHSNRGRPSSGRHIPTIGGLKLRELRSKKGLSLTTFGAEAEYHKLSTEDGAMVAGPHLQRIESGQTKMPDYATLDTILTILDASYIERREVFEAFGYKVKMTLPTADEIRSARASSQAELENATWPVYLLDCGQRILAWNRYVPRLIGRNPNDLALRNFMGCTAFDIAFNPDFGITLQIENPEEFLPALLCRTKYELSPFVGEQWYSDLITHARTFCGFSEVWDRVDEAPLKEVGSRILTPVKLAVPKVGVLQFLLYRSPFVKDQRFHVVHYTPYGAETLRQCALWADQEGIG